jgi:hypothetical protein
VAQGAADRVAVHVRQVHVQQDQVEGTLLVGGLEALRAGSGLEDLELLRLLGLEDRPDQRTRGHVIVDDEDSLGHSFSLAYGPLRPAIVAETTRPAAS